MVAIGLTNESDFNDALGRSLARMTARWQDDISVLHVEETRIIVGKDNLRKRPDVLIIESTAPPLVIETSYRAADAEQDAIDCLGKETVGGRLAIWTAISVHIPVVFSTLNGLQMESSLLKGELIRYAIFEGYTSKETGKSSLRRWPLSGWLSGTVFDLSSLVSAPVLPRRLVEEVADAVASLVHQAASGLTQALPEHQQNRVTELVHQRSPLAGLWTTMVLWLNALLIQHRLASQNVKDAQPLRFQLVYQPDPAEQALTWRQLLQQNWSSIFEPAVEVLEVTGNLDPSATSMALKKLLSAVQEIEIARLGLYINIGAELFPLLSSDRKKAAAFYTQAGTAELLASLTIQRDDLSKDDWATSELLRGHTLGDLACGTGTLLLAGYRRILRFHEEAGGTVKTSQDLHQYAMEEGLVGTDISPVAAHLTAASLAAIGAGNPFGATRVGWVDVGGPEGMTGSLEYLQSDSLDDLLSSLGGRSSGQSQASTPVAVLDNSLDWVLMNPPYSRTRGGQSAFDVGGLSTEERKACQKRWGELVRRTPVNRHAGMAASFLMLAWKKIKPGGTIGFVLPRTAALAETWASIREMMINEFCDIKLVAVESGRALGAAALSKDTHMEEMLLVATRRQQPRNICRLPKPKELLHSISLKYSPVQSGEAGEVARIISEALRQVQHSRDSVPLRLGDEEIGLVYAFEAPTNGTPWYQVGVTQPELVKSATALFEGILQAGDHSLDLGVELLRIGDLFQLGPTHDLIGHLEGRDERGAFKFYPIASHTDELAADLSLWSADSRTQTSLQVHPTHHGVANRLTDDSLRDRVRLSRGSLHYARNMRWTSQSILAASTVRDVLGGATWTTLSHADKRVLSAMAIWCNSTLGMLMHWTQGQRTQPGRSRTQIQAIRQIPCPKFDELSDAQLTEANSHFEQLSQGLLKPACQAHCDQARQRIDSAVVQLLRLPQLAEEILVDLRAIWCSEPSVHGWNTRAIRLLKESQLNN